MSIEAKERFFTDVKEKLSDCLTVTEMDNVLEIMRFAMVHYDIRDIDRNFSGNDDMLKMFIDALMVEGRSQKTLKRYEYIIGRMLKSVKVKTADISVFDIRNYLSKEKQRGIADRTLEGNRQIFGAYFGWLQRECLIKENPVKNIGAIKSVKKVKDIFSEVDIELMKKNCKTKRDIALITFLASTGCRVSEAISININDVNFNTLECKILGKGNKERIVYLDQVAGMFLRQYLDDRTDNNEALFMNKRNERLGTNGVRVILKEIEKKSGVKNVHPHKFRRTLATTLIKHGMPIEEVAAILGHDKLDTTMQYVVLDKSDIKHAYLKYV